MLNKKIELGNKNYRDFHQMCFLVEDCEEASKLWAEVMGAGPFAVVHYKDTLNLKYKGEEMDWIMHGANGQWGPVQIELMQTVNDCPAVHYKPQPGLGKLHHINWVCEDLEAETKRLEALGYPMVWEASAGDNMLIRMFDADKMLGCLIEVYQYNESTEQTYAMLRKQHENWDGKNPIACYFDNRIKKIVDKFEVDVNLYKPENIKSW